MSNASRILEIILKAKDDTAKGVKGAVDNMDAIDKKAAAIGAGMTAAGVATGVYLNSATKDTQAYVGEIVNLQRMTGLSAEESSKMTAVFQRYGIEGKGVAVMVKTLSASIVGHNKELAAAGIATQDVNGKNRDATAVMADLADYYSKSTDKTAASALAAKVLGKNWSALLPVLAGGKSSIEGITTAAEKNGAVYSQDQLDTMKKLAAAQKDNTAALAAFTNKVGLANAPIETFKAKTLGGLIDKLNGVSPALGTVGVGIAQAVAGIGTTFGPLLMWITVAFPGAISGALASVGGFFSGLAGTIGGFLTTSIPAFLASVGGVLAAIPSFIASATGAVAGGLVAVAVALGVGLGFAINGLLQKIPGYQAAWNRMLQPLWDFADKIPAMWSKAKKKFTDGLDALVLAVKGLPKRMVDGLGNLASRLTAPVQAALKVLNLLNPFMRHSPSLVDNVLAGTAVIANAYAGLGGMRVTAPSIGGISAGANFAFSGGSRVAAPQPIHVYLDGRELNRGLATTSSTTARSGAR